MFAFGFDDAAAPAPPDSAAASPSEPLRAARELLAASAPPQSDSTWPIERITVGGGSRAAVVELIKRVPPESAVPSLMDAETSDQRSLAGELAASDLVPNVYEGGFKVWECARDLLEVLHEQSSGGDGELRLDGASVLEAGCGAGLPAALAMHLGARQAVLQDYNDAVLTAVTLPTFRLNALWPHVESGRVRFVSGDWACVSAMLRAERDAAAAADAAGGEKEGEEAGRAAASGGGFDVLLSADTIYSPSAAPRLWRLVREQLAVGGVALIAAKTYYFGVGGSVAAFKGLVDADGRFECRTVRTFEDGASNRREVFAVRWRREEEARTAEDVERGRRGRASDDGRQELLPAKRTRV